MHGKVLCKCVWMSFRAPGPVKVYLCLGRRDALRSHPRSQGLSALTIWLGLFQAEAFGHTDWALSLSYCAKHRRLDQGSASKSDLFITWYNSHRKPTVVRGSLISHGLPSFVPQFSHL